ncbi:hypothetical protein PPERSA_01206 [Pseudocohnilembus persalinus]|uniref:NIF system FeS cluster assembly NifU N-terminal domain-containing protein n=1 Tax=Pseudocohnilembus persalinus TaxID=266149 RepID=A0A0V0QBI0_PSEPJ|nr:hypothetical protein PPERSA_01206 [Pseudocohnilembus persalinus]|eukprot:KRW99560.1 hypothetical protein PPERSA_01206 [Pseudocohnilembus persalinus]
MFKIIAKSQNILNQSSKLSQLSLNQVPKFNYHERVIDHYENPRNVGSLDKNLKNVGTGLVGAPACGDVMRLQIEVNEDGKTIKKAVFKVILSDKDSFLENFFTFGCGSAIASSSYATELLAGMNIDEAVNIKNQDIAQYLKLPPVKLHCSMLAEDAIKKAVHDFKNKNNSSAQQTEQQQQQ